MPRMPTYLHGKCVLKILFPPPPMESLSHEKLSRGFLPMENFPMENFSRRKSHLRKNPPGNFNPAENFHRTIFPEHLHMQNWATKKEIEQLKGFLTYSPLEISPGNFTSGKLCSPRISPPLLKFPRIKFTPPPKNVCILPNSKYYL